ncbi:hypothetical protein [Rhodophyticola sp.]|uniref:hypothetical protein n=1 Tax=Rhodophyticola sp. TaxID=2680032 RepID=UPI003D2C93C3
MSGPSCSAGIYRGKRCGKAGKIAGVQNWSRREIRPFPGRPLAEELRDMKCTGSLGGNRQSTLGSGADLAPKIDQEGGHYLGRDICELLDLWIVANQEVDKAAERHGAVVDRHPGKAGALDLQPALGRSTHIRPRIDIRPALVGGHSRSRDAVAEVVQYKLCLSDIAVPEMGGRLGLLRVIAMEALHQGRRRICRNCIVQHVKVVGGDKFRRTYAGMKRDARSHPGGRPLWRRLVIPHRFLALAEIRNTQIDAQVICELGGIHGRNRQEEPIVEAQAVR